MQTEELRKTATNLLDGMSYNKNKFAEGVLALCDRHNQLQSAYTAAQAKAQSLEEELSRLKRTSSGASKTPPFPPEFGDMFNGFPKGNRQ